jgi:hypothetical protein
MSSKQLQQQQNETAQYGEQIAALQQTVAHLQTTFHDAMSEMENKYEELKQKILSQEDDVHSKKKLSSETQAFLTARHVAYPPAMREYVKNPVGELVVNENVNKNIRPYAENTQSEWDALRKACVDGEVEVLKTLLATTTYRTETTSYMEISHLAFTNGKVDILKELINYKDNVLLKDSESKKQQSLEFPPFDIFMRNNTIVEC